MTLCVERHSGALWLVAYAAPGDATCQLLAEFQSEAAASVWQRAHVRAMGFAREVGRSGLG